MAAGAPPRRRGSTPRLEGAAALLMAPPRRRGSTLGGAQGDLGGAGSPAQAGVHPGGMGRRWATGAPPRRRGSTRAPARRPRPWLPRAGGGPPRSWTALRPGVGAPPRRRGSTPLAATRAHKGGSPAQAGVHPATRRERRPRRGLPRAGGGPPRLVPRRAEKPWAPPRRRGSTRLGCAASQCTASGSPAQAGVHPDRRTRPNGAKRLPRAGGGPPHAKGARWWQQRLPRAGGGPPVSRQLIGASVGSPAQAGVHPFFDSVLSVTAAPPRRRGST